jgi:hypothetical protein
MASDDGKELRKSLQECLKKMKARHKWQELADFTGIPKASLQTFASNGDLGTEHVRTLERWLAAHGYLDAGAAQPGQATAQPTQPTQPPAPPAAQADSTTQADAFARLAAELHALADHLSSPLPADIRLVTYMAAIKRYAATLDAKEKELKEQIK